MEKPLIAIGYNVSHSAWMFRGNLIKALLGSGHRVVVLAPYDDYVSRLKAMGCEHIDVPIRMNKNPISDIKIYLKFLSVMRRVRPDAFLGYTIKPNVYGTLAAATLGIPVISNISGLGATFIADNFITKIVKFLYRVALKRSDMVFFQNPDDQNLFLQERILTHDRYGLVPGSGVDLARYPFTPVADHKNERPIRFLFVGRMLWDKGVKEYVDAAAMLLGKGRKYEFHMLGQTSVDNPAAVPAEELTQWEESGLVTHRGFQEDVYAEMSDADCVVLPSYREGTPRSLLEAAAIGRPIVTTDAVGCRTTVDDGITGYLCKLKDAEDLALKMDQIGQKPLVDRQKMGANARLKMEKEFDELIVIEIYLQTLKNLLETQT